VSAEARERTALSEAVRFEAGLPTVSRWKGAVAELVERNWPQITKTIDTKEAAELEV
jgi:hypothetical protein